jgi:hypothetical protein
MPKKQTRKRRSSHSGGAASYQKARIKPANTRQTRSKAIGQMFKDFQNFFTRKRKVQPVNYEVSSERLGGSSPFELVISSNSNRNASPFIVVDMPKPHSSKGSRVSSHGQDFTSAVIVGRGSKNKKRKKSKRRFK